MLLRDPAQAIATGYFDHTFVLTPEERDLVLGIRAQRLEDFAAQVHRWISGNGNGNGHNNGNGHSNGNGNGHKGPGYLADFSPAEGPAEFYRGPAVVHV